MLALKFHDTENEATADTSNDMRQLFNVKKYVHVTS